MLGCGLWIRDKDDVAAFRCGDKSNKGIELCFKCVEKEINKIEDKMEVVVDEKVKE